MFRSEDEVEIKKRLSEITHDVKIVLFSQTFNCETCPETETLLKELAGLSERIKLELRNPQIDREEAARYKITMVPSVVIEGDRDYGIRLFVGRYRFRWKTGIRFERGFERKDSCSFRAVKSQDFCDTHLTALSVGRVAGASYGNGE